MALNPTVITSQTLSKKKNERKKPASIPVEYCSYLETYTFKQKGITCLWLIALSYFHIQSVPNKGKDERVGSNDRIIYLHKIMVLEDPPRPIYTDVFSFKVTSHLGFFFTCMRENGFESVELNWFAAALTQTPEAPIIYPIIPRAHGQQTFPLRFVDGFHSQVLWLTQSSSFKRDRGSPQFSHRLCRLRETDSIRNVIQQPMIARESGTLEKSNELIKCFVCLVYFCHFANEAKDGRWHFLFYRQS